MSWKQVAAAGLLSLLSGTSAWAAGDQAGTVTTVGGWATVERDGARVRLTANEKVYVGDVLRTGADGKLAVKFGDGSNMLLARNAELEVAEYMVGAQSRLAKFRLWSGRIRAIVSKFTGEQNDFRVTSPTAVAGVRGTDFTVTLEPVDTAATPSSAHENPAAFQTTVAVLKGKVAVTGPDAAGGEVVLTAGQASTVRFQNAPGAPRELSPEEIKQLEASNNSSGGSQFAGGGASPNPAADAAASMPAGAAENNPGGQPVVAPGENAAANALPPFRQDPGIRADGDVSGSLPAAKTPVKVEVNRVKP